MIMLALVAVGATALEVSSPTLGDDNQDRVSDVRTTFTVRNNDAIKVENLAITFANGAEASKYSLEISGLPSSLDPGQSASVTLNGTIPLDHSAIDDDFDETAIKIGTITVDGKLTNGTQVSKNSDINMQAVNQFRIQRTRVECGTTSETVEDGDEVENLKPGAQCTVEVEVENEFDDNDRDNKKIGDIDFTSITTRFDSDDGDADIDEDDEIDDLDAKDEDTITAEIDVDEDANDGNIRITISFDARDENGARHGEKIEFDLEIDRLTHDLVIRNIDVSPSRVSACSASVAKVSVSVLNQGKRDEDEAAVELEVQELGFQEKRSNLELDEDDRTTVSFDVPIEKGTEEGVYRMDVTTFFDNLAESNRGSVEITVDECQIEEEPEPEEQEPQEEEQQGQTVVVRQPAQQQIQPSGSQAVAAPQKSSVTQTPAYTALLAVLIVLLMIAIAFMGYMLFKKK